jgi:hypothetical protein
MANQLPDYATVANTVAKEITKKPYFLNCLIFLGLFLYGLFFLPENIVKALGIFELINSYRDIIVSYGIVSIGLLIYAKYHKYKAQKQRKKLLHNLTPEEKGYLSQYITNKTNTLYFLADDGVIWGLCYKKITFFVMTGMLFPKSAYNLHSWAREYLEKNSNLLNDAAEVDKKKLASISSFLSHRS